MDGLLEDLPLPALQAASSHQHKSPQPEETFTRLLPLHSRPLLTRLLMGTIYSDRRLSYSGERRAPWGPPPRSPPPQASAPFRC